MGLGSWIRGREMESWEALREGGPTKRVGAGSRLGFEVAVGDGLVVADMVGGIIAVYISSSENHHVDGEC